MNILQTSDRRLTRSELLRYLSRKEEESWTERTVYIKPTSFSEGSPAVLLSGTAITTALGHVGSSQTGFILIRRDEEIEVIEPPIPIPMDAIMENQDLLLLEEMFDDLPKVGVILLRLGRFAVAVLDGEDIIASKTERRHVKNRHRAGGSSQRRFERSRERLVRELYDKTCAVTRDIFESRTGAIEYIFLGGEKHTLNGFRKRCSFLEKMEDKIMTRVLRVNQPDQSSLQSIHEEVFSSRLRTFEVIA